MGKWKNPHPLKQYLSDEQEAFLVANWQHMTNEQLAKAMGVKITWLRYRMREKGLRRVEMEYWTGEQVAYLEANYKTKGDVELAEIFEQRWPKNKPWKKQHICKKRAYLKLARTSSEVFAIASANSRAGGKSYTIDRNSSSKNLHPSWVAQRIAWRNKDLQDEVRKDEGLMQAATTLYQLKRAIKAHDR